LYAVKGLFLGIVFAVLLFGFSFSQDAFAATITAVPGGGNWNAGSTWVGGVAPGAGDVAVIPLGITVSVTSGEIVGSIDNSGTLIITDGRTLSVFGGTINNSGDIRISGASAATKLQIDGTVTLTGGGTVTMSDYSANWITSNAGSLPNDTLVNVDNTIQGAGNIGLNLLKIDNQAAGIIEANQPTRLIVDPDGSGLTNTGVMRSVGTLVQIPSNLHLLLTLTLVVQ